MRGKQWMFIFSKLFDTVKLIKYRPGLKINIIAGLKGFWPYNKVATHHRYAQIWIVRMILFNISITHMDLAKDKMLLHQKVEHDPREGPNSLLVALGGVFLEGWGKWSFPSVLSEHVEHCVHFWVPQYMRDLDSLQWRAMKMMKELKNLCCEEWLRELVLLGLV